MTNYEKLTIIVSSITSIISLLISVSTLKQNNKMIEESTRPNIIVYGVLSNYGSLTYSIFIKNFGNNGAVIKKIKAQPCFD